MLSPFTDRGTDGGDGLRAAEQSDLRSFLGSQEPDEFRL